MSLWQKWWCQWKEQNTCINNCFFTENNYPKVWVVILTTILFNMSTAIQEIERAGRDGKLAKCYIIPAMENLPCHSVNDS